MAKRQFKNKTERRQQLLLKYSTICMVVVVLLARLDSGGGGVVDALSISLNGNGNRFQQQQQEQRDENPQQTQQQQLQHVATGEAEDVHNYIMQKSTTELVPYLNDVLNEDNNDMILNGNGIDSDLTNSQLTFGHPFPTLKMIKRSPPPGFIGLRGKRNTYAVSNMENYQDFLKDDSLTEGLEVQSKNKLFFAGSKGHPFWTLKRIKRAPPPGFIGLRGKRNTYAVSNMENDQDFLKDDVLTEGLEVQSKNKLFFADSKGHPFHTLKMIKRAPPGFIGMRGKKDTFAVSNMENDQDFLDDDALTEGLAFPWQELANNDDDVDDDDDDDLINWNSYAKSNGRRYKKAPTAFYGVRGKKFTPGNGVNPSGDTIRWNNFLQKLDEDRMRDMIMANVMDTLLEHNNNGYDVADDNNAQNEMAKRAPTGFTGVRGKRPALSLGGDPSMESVAKRGLGNAFVGVRGKKDVSHQTFKRSPLGGSERYFFDFWKKSAALGGPGGKRQRFTDFGNKFVAVRGKKSPYNGETILTNDWAAYKDNIRRSPPELALSSLLAAAAAEGQLGERTPKGAGAGAGTSMHLLYDNSGKRAPSGFLGMRGKRPVTSDDLLTIN